MNQSALTQLAEKLEQSATEVCGMMLGEAVAAGGHCRWPLDQDQAADVVRGTISIAGDFEAEATIHLPQVTAVNLVAAFLGGPVEADDAAFDDAVGELANMVIGSAKSRLEGLACSISCPRVVHQQMPAAPITRDPDFWLPLSGPSGDFAIEVQLAA